MGPLQQNAAILDILKRLEALEAEVAGLKKPAKKTTKKTSDK